VARVAFQRATRRPHGRSNASSSVLSWTEQRHTRKTRAKGNNDRVVRFFTRASFTSRRRSSVVGRRSTTGASFSPVDGTASGFAFARQNRGKSRKKRPFNPGCSLFGGIFKRYPLFSSGPFSGAASRVDPLLLRRRRRATRTGGRADARTNRRSDFCVISFGFCSVRFLFGSVRASRRRRAFC
jgi:hypothetical protein